MEHPSHEHSHGHDHAGHCRHDAESKTQGNETDPVCGMKVVPGSNALNARHGGKIYYFCGERCRAKFLAVPEAFIDEPGGEKTAETSAPKSLSGNITSDYRVFLA